MKNTALKYGNQACITMMKKFDAPDLPPKGGFHYHAGVFLSGMMELYKICGEEAYFIYVRNWVDSIVLAPGVIDCYMKGSLDDYMAGILLIPLYEKTKDEKYSVSLKMLMANIRNWIKNSHGGFWHKEWYPNQMWLDGLYMAGPLQALYGKTFKEKYFLYEAVHQAIIMYENMQDKKTKLLYHAWDSSKMASWCNKETGLAPEFWGRALGWYVVAILDIMECLDPNSEAYAKLLSVEREVLSAVLSYQNRENHLWYQVVNKAENEGNWPESSCSCLFVYAAAKAVRMGVIEEKYLQAALLGFESIIKEFTRVDNDGNFILSGVCIGTGVLDYDGYIKRPTSENDLHGMGAFLLMCSEIAKI